MVFLESILRVDELSDTQLWKTIATSPYAVMEQSFSFKELGKWLTTRHVPEYRIVLKNSDRNVVSRSQTLQESNSDWLLLDVYAQTCRLPSGKSPQSPAHDDDEKALLEDDESGTSEGFWNRLIVSCVSAGIDEAATSTNTAKNRSGTHSSSGGRPVVEEREGEGEGKGEASSSWQKGRANNREPEEMSMNEKKKKKKKKGGGSKDDQGKRKGKGGSGGGSRLVTEEEALRRGGEGPPPLPSPQSSRRSREGGADEDGGRDDGESEGSGGSERGGGGGGEGGGSSEVELSDELDFSTYQSAVDFPSSTSPSSSVFIGDLAASLFDSAGSLLEHASERVAASSRASSAVALGHGTRTYSSSSILSAERDASEEGRERRSASPGPMFPLDQDPQASPAAFSRHTNGALVATTTCSSGSTQTFSPPPSPSGLRETQESPYCSPSIIPSSITSTAAIPTTPTFKTGSTPPHSPKSASTSAASASRAAFSRGARAGETSSGAEEGEGGEAFSSSGGGAKWSAPLVPHYTSEQGEALVALLHAMLACGFGSRDPSFEVTLLSGLCEALHIPLETLGYSASRVNDVATMAWLQDHSFRVRRSAALNRSQTVRSRRHEAPASTVSPQSKTDGTVKEEEEEEEEERSSTEPFSDAGSGSSDPTTTFTTSPTTMLSTSPITTPATTSTNTPATTSTNTPATTSTNTPTTTSTTYPSTTSMGEPTADRDPSLSSPRSEGTLPVVNQEGAAAAEPESGLEGAENAGGHGGGAPPSVAASSTPSPNTGTTNAATTVTDSPSSSTTATSSSQPVAVSKSESGGPLLSPLAAFVGELESMAAAGPPSSPQRGWDFVQEPAEAVPTTVTQSAGSGGGTLEMANVAGARDSEFHLIAPSWAVAHLSLLSASPMLCDYLMCSLLLVAVREGTYDARARAAIFQLALILGVNEYLLLAAEDTLLDSLRHATELEHASTEQLSRTRSKGTYWKIALAVVAGGALLAVTGFAAAPLIGGLAAGAAVGLGGSVAAASTTVGTVTTMVVGSSLTVGGAVVAGRGVAARMDGVSEVSLVKAAGSGLHVTFAVSGWLDGEDDDFVADWQDWHGSLETGDHYVLRWETTELRSLGRDLRQFVADSIKSTVAFHVLKLTVLSVAAAPLTALSSVAYINNSWNVAADRAVKAGVVLAEMIMEKRLGQRPISLVGYSMGARLIFSCLQTLADRNAVGLIDSVVLIGAAVDCNGWARARSVVAGRLVNAYNSTDWALALAYRLANLSVAVAGVSPVTGVAGIENIDVSGEVNGLSGHLSYKHSLRQILDFVGFAG